MIDFSSQKSTLYQVFPRNHQASRLLVICIAKSASKSISLMTDDYFQRFTSTSFYISMTPSHDFGNPYIALPYKFNAQKGKLKCYNVSNKVIMDVTIDWTFMF